MLKCFLYFFFSSIIVSEENTSSTETLYSSLSLLPPAFTNESKVQPAGNSRSPSASSPDLSHSYTDITSLFFPEPISLSDRLTQLSLTADSWKSAEGRNRGFFYIGEESLNLGFSLRNYKFSRPSIVNNKPVEISHPNGLSYPASTLGHLHKSHTSPNLTTLVA